MKALKFNKSLKLNKKTIADLDNGEMRKIYGAVVSQAHIGVTTIIVYEPTCRTCYDTCKLEAPIISYCECP